MHYNRRLNAILILLFACLLHFPQSSVAENTTTKFQAPLFDNLGSYHFAISTKVPMAQKFFDQGMVLYYGFEWGESIRSFKEAARLDPNCGMCYWGLALATGSKMNAPVSGHEYIDAKNAVQKALTLKKYETPAEQAYINALSFLFRHKPKPYVPSTGIFSCHVSNSTLDVSSKSEISNYTKAMKRLAADYPADLNAQALYTYAEFNAIQWQTWDKNGKINPATPALIHTLESIFARDKLNIGGNHYYIHVVESSPNPEVALESADRLRTLVPGSEHLVHMPTHIYMLTGRYHEGSESNQQAIEVFKQYNKTCLAQGFEPEINYLYFHNYDFLRTTATMEGRKDLALSAVHEMLQPSPFASWLKNELSLQWFIPIPYFVEARFGLWQDILKEAKPDNKYQYAIGMWHYARGMAYANLNNMKSAGNESAMLDKIIHSGPKDNNLQKNGIKLLTIADSILKAVINDHNGNEKLTISYLKTADKIQHDMGYHEPPDWYFPVKDALGDAYLKWHHPAQAAEMFQQELRQYPKNGWALFALAQSMRELGKNQQAEEIDREFKEAWKHADIAKPVYLFGHDFR